MTSAALRAGVLSRVDETGTRVQRPCARGSAQRIEPCRDSIISTRPELSPPASDDTHLETLETHDPTHERAVIRYSASQLASTRGDRLLRPQRFS
jgi:hypothetical protein